MSNEFLTLAFFCWLAAALIALTGRARVVTRILLSLGAASGVVATISALPNGTSSVVIPTRLAGEAVQFQLSPDALWLLGFGLAPAALACALATPARQGMSGWLFGAAMSLIGVLGVFGVRNGAGFLVAWEIMSFGGAVMIFSEKLSTNVGRPVLFMLGLLEVGAVALVVAIVILAVANHGFSFDGFAHAASGLSLSPC